MDICPSVTLRGKFATSPLKMQSKLAAQWVSALALLKALGNQIWGPTHPSAHTPGGEAPLVRSLGTLIPAFGVEWRQVVSLIKQPRCSPGHICIITAAFPHKMSSWHSPPLVPELQLHSRTCSLHMQTHQTYKPILLSLLSSLNFPKQRQFLPPQRNYSSSCNTIRQETRSAAASTCIALC